MTANVPAGWPAPANIENIRTSLSALKLSEREAGLAFYGRLFEVAPGVRPMFPASLENQAEKLIKTLKVLVASLERLDTVVPVLRELGRKHVAYGAQPGHYGVVGSTLLWTLREALGEDFTPEVEQDWQHLFSVAAQ
ncbi:MAG: hypothetical protein KIT83_21975, partial [Bryobacterales bacterium]|nr:hypothetical protein [Bryobacterales bacterium]